MASPWGFVLALAGVLLAWTLVSRWAQGHGVTGPMVFLATGLVLSLSLIHISEPTRRH